MKKTFLILLSLIVLGVAGCSTKPEENKATPTPTPAVTTEVPMEGPTAAPTTKPEETVVPNLDLEIGDTFIQGSFVENTDNSPTTITFMKDGNFTSNVNACTGMVFIEGSYLKDGDTITLSFPAETGVNYLDKDQPFYFTVEGTVLKDKDQGGFSCADVGEYQPIK